MKCPLPLTLEAREMRGHGKGRGRGGGEMGDRYKKKERDFVGLALDALPHVFLDPTTNLGDFTVPNTPSLPFINPLLSFASCDDLEEIIINDTYYKLSKLPFFITFNEYKAFK